MAYSTNLYVIAAICGNFWQESTVNPGIWENLTVGAPGFGLGQWTDNPPAVMRRTALFNYLDGHGLTRSSGPGQLQFLIDENLWIPSLISPSAYSTLSDYLASTSTNLPDLVLEWMYHWEGINDGTDSIRLTAAQRYLNLFQNDPGTRDPWHASNQYLSLGQADNNALLIMDWMTGAAPAPITPTDEEILAIVSTLLKKRKNGGMILVF